MRQSGLVQNPQGLTGPSQGKVLVVFWFKH